MKPLVFDLFCGLGGWTEAFLDRGYRAIGFDIEAHDYGSGGYPGELVLRDIRSLTGAELVKEYGVPAVIVASPPCQEFSYMAMPWSKAKEKQRKIEADANERERLTDLFRQCFRIQREVSDAAGVYVPLIIENVRGAQKWVGKARWNFGSFYLWGDVPALMPIPGKVRKTPDGSWDLNRENYNPEHRWEGVKAGDRNTAAAGGHKWSNSFADTLRGEGNKTVGMDWSDPTKRGQDFTRIGGKQSGQKTVGHVNKRDGYGHTRHLTNPDGQPLGKNELGRRYGSKSSKRKQASAEIAKIPYALADWIARCFKPEVSKV